MCIFFLTLVTPMSKDWTSFGSAGALVSPPRRFKLETPIWSWNMAVFPSGSVGSLAWKLQTTREVSACMQVFIDKVILTLRDTVHAHTDCYWI